MRMQCLEYRSGTVVGENEAQKFEMCLATLPLKTAEIASFRASE